MKRDTRTLLVCAAKARGKRQDYSHTVTFGPVLAFLALFSLLLYDPLSLFSLHLPYLTSLYSISHFPASRFFSFLQSVSAIHFIGKPFTFRLKKHGWITDRSLVCLTAAKESIRWPLYSLSIKQWTKVCKDWTLYQPITTGNIEDRSVSKVDSYTLLDWVWTST